MATIPHSHRGRAPARTPAASSSAGPQDLDEVTDEEEEAAKRDEREAAKEAASTGDGKDIGRETGELYGQGIAPTADVDDDEVRGAQDFSDEGGESFTEALETGAAESGTAGNAPLDDVRGTEADPSGGDDDRPIADHGAGGPAGL